MVVDPDQIFKMFCLSQVKFNIRGTCCYTACLLYENFKLHDIKSIIVLGSWTNDTEERFAHVWVQIGQKVYDPMVVLNKLKYGEIINPKYYPCDYNGVMFDINTLQIIFDPDLYDSFRDMIKDCYFGRGAFKDPLPIN